MLRYKRSFLKLMGGSGKREQQVGWPWLSTERERMWCEHIHVQGATTVDESLSPQRVSSAQSEKRDKESTDQTDQQTGLRGGESVAGVRLTEAHVPLTIRLFHAHVVHHEQVDLDLRGACPTHTLEGWGREESEKENERSRSSESSGDGKTCQAQHGFPCNFFASKTYQCFCS